MAIAVITEDGNVVGETCETVYTGSHKKNVISEQERAKRAKAVRYATASVALEGFKLDENDEHDLRFVNGEISLAEYTAK
ncbi:MAG: antitoxin VbhA family protein [Helicobacteraceae bacterium]|nr:antitoxin VbhA family protein [Helicobacteraceae bacterium]